MKFCRSLPVHMDKADPRGIHPHDRAPHNCRHGLEGRRDSCGHKLMDALMTNDFPSEGQPTVGVGPYTRRRALRPTKVTADPGQANGVLLGWQAAAFRGFTVIENRLDRRSVVKTLVSGLARGEHLPSAMLVAADEVTADQWAEYLSRDRDGLPAGWTVLTPASILAEVRSGTEGLHRHRGRAGDVPRR